MIEFDLHTHSISSGHGTDATITDMAKAASNRGLSLLGISDHGPKTPFGPSESYFRSLSLAPRKRSSVSILYGIETDILDLYGSLDIDAVVASSLDYVIASMHPCNMKPGSRTDNTSAYIRAMEHPFVSIIGHCDDEKYPVDMENMVNAAMKNNVLLELNNASLKPDSYRGNTREADILLLQLCKRNHYPVLLSSDSHGVEGIGIFDDALSLIHECEFPEELILNYDVNRLKHFLK